MSDAGNDAPRVLIVTGLLRDGDRVLLCHRSPRRRVLPDVWDLPGGHVERGEEPRSALVRELREELGIEAVVPVGPPTWKVRADTADMRIWRIESWTGVPTNIAVDEHTAVGWFRDDELAALRLAHDDYRSMFAEELLRR